MYVKRAARTCCFRELATQRSMNLRTMGSRMFCAVCLNRFLLSAMRSLTLHGPHTTGRPPRGSRTLVVGIARFPERAAPRNATSKPKFTISILISRSTHLERVFGFDVDGRHAGVEWVIWSTACSLPMLISMQRELVECMRVCRRYKMVHRKVMLLLAAAARAPIVLDSS